MSNRRRGVTFWCVRVLNTGLIKKTFELNLSVYVENNNNYPCPNMKFM